MGCLVKFKGVDCGSGYVHMNLRKCLKSTPSRVGLDEFEFETDIGGSDMMRS
jgi:hypothetical protein